MEDKNAGGFIWKCGDRRQPENPKMDTEVESWISLSEFPRYKISRDGRIYSSLYKRLLKDSTKEEGRKYFTISDKDWVAAIHQIIM